jgi:hypothetical protein
MNSKKIKLLVDSIDLLVQSIKIELEDIDIPKKENIIRLEDLLGNQSNHHSKNEYEPDYYEEE